MNNNIRLHMYKYVSAELAYVVLMWFVLYWLSSGFHQWIQTFILLMCCGAAARIFILWNKFRQGSLEILGGQLFFKGLACDVTLLNNFLPLGIGSTIKVSYFEDTMQKRSIYISKNALSHEDWLQLLEHRT
ncbi:TPA: hypothetical protein AB5H75_003756 [Vibrio mimicus]|uniref:hypothetical protein n=1 Tax=Vibrio cholerae TaxID=666 RepID=UPI001F26AD45|nr:hypothetical protein [Vibrio cholerae]MCR9707705.1 hypothetical protein [Vibrio cholerae]